MKIKLTKKATVSGETFARNRVLEVGVDLTDKIAQKLIKRGYATEHKDPTDGGGDGDGQADLSEPE